MNKKERSHQYYLENKEKFIEQTKEYRKNNKQKVLECRREYRENNLEKHKKWGRKYYDKNRKIIYLRNKDYQEKNHIKVHAQKMAHKQTPKGRFSKFKSSAKRRGFLVNLTFDEWYSIASQSCLYCGRENLTMGLDRVNSMKGYLISNVVSCCYPCNIAKSNLTQNEFLEICSLIAKRFEQGLII